MKVKSITARKISDSRGIATVEVKVTSADGVFIAAAPSGTSSGRHEAVSVDVKKALYNVREIIAPKLLSQEFFSQKEVDEVLIELAGPRKENMGANAILPVSIAYCRALARHNDLPLYKFISEYQNSEISQPLLPKPCVLLIEGSLHANNKLDVQEFMATGDFDSFEESYKAASEVYESLGKVLLKEFGSKASLQGLEGGFAPKIDKTEYALDLIMQAIEQTPHKGRIKIGLDVAASEFWSKGKYNFENKVLEAPQLSRFYKNIAKEYPILFIEDPFAEDDFEGWGSIKALREKGVLIVGDDLTVTNLGRIQKAKQAGLCNAVIIKPNQIGTVTETIEAAILAKKSGWKRIVSHRSGDTMDDFIADLAVGTAAEFIKSGGPFAKERKAKYDRLLQIEKDLI